MSARDARPRAEACAPPSPPAKRWPGAIAAGPITFHGLRNGQLMQASALRRTRSQRRYPARKVLTEVRRDTGVTVAVPRRFRHQLALLYGGDDRSDNYYKLSEGTTSVAFGECPAEEGATLYYAGGLITSRPGCYSLRVTVPGRSRPLSRRFGIAVPKGSCPR
jgi:hypothetical protein